MRAVLDPTEPPLRGGGVKATAPQPQEDRGSCYMFRHSCERLNPWSSASDPQ